MPAGGDIPPFLSGRRAAPERGSIASFDMIPPQLEQGCQPRAGTSQIVDLAARLSVLTGLAQMQGVQLFLLAMQDCTSPHQHPRRWSNLVRNQVPVAFLDIDK
jgi:hypothetical protein